MYNMVSLQKVSRGLDLPRLAPQVPDLKSMKDHFESKHPKMEFDEKRCEDVHQAAGGVTTAGVAVRGSTKHAKK